jgi:Protein of unknown function (DUF3592)
MGRSVDLGDSASLFGLVFALVGGAFALQGVRSARASRAFERVAERADGEVIDYRYETVGPPGDHSRRSIPVVRFTLPDGRTVQTEARMGTSPGLHFKGSEVTVLYDPEDPRRARIEGFMAGGGVLVSGCMTAVGLLFFLFGISALVGGRLL